MRIQASESGGVGVRIIVAALTLCLIGTLIAFLLNNYQEQQKENHRKAGRICEYGLQLALEKLSSEPSWKKGFEKNESDGGWYAVSVRSFKRNDTAMISIQSQGHKGSVSDARECILALIVSGKDSAWVQRSMH